MAGRIRYAEDEWGDGLRRDGRVHGREVSPKRPRIGQDMVGKERVGMSGRGTGSVVKRHVIQGSIESGGKGMGEQESGQNWGADCKLGINRKSGSVDWRKRMSARMGEK